MPLSEEEIRKRHSPQTSSTPEVFEGINVQFINTAAWLDENLPEGREKALAHTYLETAHFWASKAHARGTDVDK